MHQNAIFMGEKIIDSELFPFEKNLHKFQLESTFLHALSLAPNEP